MLLDLACDHSESAAFASFCNACVLRLQALSFARKAPHTYVTHTHTHTPFSTSLIPCEYAAQVLQPDLELAE